MTYDCPQTTQFSIFFIIAFPIFEDSEARNFKFRTQVDHPSMRQTTPSTGRGQRHVTFSVWTSSDLEGHFRCLKSF